MTDAEYLAEQDRMRPLFEKWVTALLDSWVVKVEYCREMYDGESEEDKKENWASTFTVHSDWSRLKAFITAYCPMTKELNDEELENHAVHELCHVLVNELRGNKDDYLDHEERVVETLARAIVGLRNSFVTPLKVEIE